MFELSLRIITTALALLLFLFVNRYARKWSPAYVFSIFWSIQIIFMSLFMADYLIFRYMGLLFIILCVIAFDLGYLANKSCVIIKRKVKIIYCEKSVWVYAFVLFLGFWGVYNFFQNNGFSLSTLFSLDSMLEMSSEVSEMRYSGEETTSGIMNKFMGVNSYAIPLVGGIMYHFFSKKIYSFVSLLPCIVAGLSAGVKMGIISGVFLWIIGFSLSSYLLDVKVIFSKRAIIFGVCVSAFFMAIFILSMMFRYGKFDVDTFYYSSGKLVAYSLGHLPAFDIWYTETTIDFWELTFGGKTFYGISNSLGLLERGQGVFGKFYTVSHNDDITNVFTVFRFFVEDFGSVGTLVYLFILGWVVKFLFVQFLSKVNFRLYTTVVCAIYFFISWSFATSIFAYATYMALFVYLYALLGFLLKERRI